MHPSRQFLSSFKVLDLVVMLSCFTFAAILVAPGIDVATIREFMGLRVSLGNFIFIGALVALWHVLFSAWGVYDDSFLWNDYHEAVNVLKATSISKSELVFRPLPEDDPKQRQPDIGLAKEKLGWEPKCELEDGLSKMIEYFGSHLSKGLTQRHRPELAMV